MLYEIDNKPMYLHTVDKLIDLKKSNENVDEIIFVTKYDKIIDNLKNKDIKDISDIKSTPVGDKYVIVLTIYVDGNMKTFDSHKLADNLEKDVNKLEKVYRTIVHVEPV